jgi:PTH1 family peptidyl-tRNA hydrolase
MRLVVGLGNPGPQYDATRHNIGFAVIDILARRHHLELSRKKFSSLFVRGRISGVDVVLAKPLTFMNLSGQAVVEIVNFFRIDPRDVLVVYDEMDIELGRMKITARGGPAGHNGMASIVQRLGTDQVPRIRIGIGRPSRGGADHVLGRWGPEERELVEPMLDMAADAAEAVISDGLSEAQTRFNRKTVKNVEG